MQRRFVAFRTAARSISGTMGRKIGSRYRWGLRCQLNFKDESLRLHHPALSSLTLRGDLNLSGFAIWCSDESDHDEVVMNWSNLFAEPNSSHSQVPPRYKRHLISDLRSRERTGSGWSLSANRIPFCLPRKIFAWIIHLFACSSWRLKKKDGKIILSSPSRGCSSTSRSALIVKARLLGTSKWNAGLRAAARVIRRRRSCAVLA